MAAELVRGHPSHKERRRVLRTFVLWPHMHASAMRFQRKPICFHEALHRRAEALEFQQM